MDELLISGKRYISARRIARDNNYTSDYIGQLIRGGKIVGQKVGRAWYVDAASFDAYLVGSEYVPEAAEVEEVPTAPTPVVEEPAHIVEEEAMSVIAAAERQSQHVENHIEVPVSLSVTAAEEEKEEEYVEPVRESRYVALTLSRPAPKLTYYDDENPTLPEIRPTLSTSRQDQDEYATVAARRASSATVAVRSWKGRHAVGLLALGMVVFIFATVVSSGVSQNLNIEANNTAAVYYSFNL